ncbi:MAG: Ig-like domain-containing protein [Mogibacterium sp.]|nr:Ig-like domain-containing protein [Mogibacterium sp.]
MTRTKSRILSLLIVFSLLVGIVGAVNVDVSYAASRKIHLKKTSITLAAGRKYQQKLISEKGKTIKASKVKWKSLKKSVAKIDRKGRVTALKAGTARMTAKYKGKTYKFTVKVKSFNSVVSVDKSNVLVLKGSTDAIAVHTDKGKDVSFTVDSKDIVSCEWGSTIEGSNDRYLNIKGLKDGSAVITVYDTCKTSVKAAINVTVVDYNTKVSVDQESMDLNVGETASLIVKTDLGKDVTYSRSNKNVSCSWGKWIDGTTNRYLYVTGDKEGTAVITISDSKNTNAAAAVTVNIKDPHVINAPATATCKEYDADGNVIGDINITTITVSKKYLRILDKYQVTVRISGTRTKCADDIELPKMTKISVSLCQNGASRYTDDILVNGETFTNGECIIPDVETGEYELVINDARP